MKRNTLAKQIAREPSQNIRRHLAQYGRELPLMHVVEFLCKRWNGETGVRLSPAEQQFYLSKFLTAVVQHDSRYFRWLADALDAHWEWVKNHSQDPLRKKLSDPGWWLQPRTPSEIAQQIGYRGNLDRLRRVLRELQVPTRRGAAGRPKKIPTRKRIFAASKS